MLQASRRRRCRPNSGVDFNANARMFDSGVAGADTSLYGGRVGRVFPHASAIWAPALRSGVTGYDSKAVDAQVAAQARLGLRYGF